LTPDEIIPDREGGVLEKNSRFESWITGRMAVVLHVRKCEPQTSKFIQENHRVSRMGPRLEHLVDLC
jgi:hypothetical protein